jgi:hypothetical protein
MTRQTGRGGNQGSSNPDGAAVKLGDEIKMRMGQQLRVMYGEVMNQGVPDRCQGLLDRLDADVVGHPQNS